MIGLGGRNSRYLRNFDEGWNEERELKYLDMVRGGRGDYLSMIKVSWIVLRERNLR